MKQNEQSNNSINWKLYEVSITAPDGNNLKGVIRYWAKDYSLCMTHPFSSQGCCGHLQYGIPAVYVTDEPQQNKVHQIALCDTAKEILLKIYEESQC